MNKKFLLTFLAISSLLVGCGEQTSISNSSSSNDIVEGDYWDVSSPDKKLNARVILQDDGSLKYSIKKNNITVIEDSTLGFSFQEANLYEMLTFENIERNEINVIYDNISGKSSQVEASCNEMKIKFKEYAFYLTVTMRAYDDGYAFKYDIESIDNAKGTFHIENELTTFTLPEDSITWNMPYKTINGKGNFFAYEEVYQRRKATNLYGRQLSMPFIYQVGDNEMYSLITESNLIGSGFYGSFLECKEDGSTALQTIHSPATIAEDDSELSYPFTSPWRVGITGSLKEVTDSELVEKVYDDVSYYRPDNYDELSSEEKKIYDYDWVEPGVVAWNWLLYTGTTSQNDFTLQKQYVDLANEMGWKYTILDGGWNANFNSNQFKEFMDYATKKNVKVIVWCNALSDFANGNLALLQSKLDTWASYGVAGIKIDFFDGQNATGQTHQGEDKKTIEWYESIYQECAKRKMVVNCHGSNKPTGERRIYPNVLNREGIKGNENKNVDAATIVNSMFTRMVVGPTDFTPTVDPLSKGMTIGSQIACSVLYESGLPSMADYPQTYARADINELFKALPACWDESEFLGGKMDEYYSVARRKNNEWFVGAINGFDQRDIEIDFSFLEPNTSYKAYLYQDGENYKDLNVSTIDLTSESKNTFSLNQYGGLTIRIVKN